MPSTLDDVRLPELPAGLAARFAVERVNSADADGIFRLVCECDIAVLGYADWALEDVTSESGPGLGGRRDQAVVRERHTGSVVSWWWTDPRAGSSGYTCDVYVRPDLEPAVGDELAGTAWQAIEGWARGFYDGQHVADAKLEVGSLVGDTATERRLAAAGFEPVRTFWRMRGDVPEQPGPAVPVPGLAIQVSDDPRLVHRLREESFADHWGFEPESFEDWAERFKRAAGYEPRYWFVASVDGEPAGIILCSRQMEAEDTLYVMIVGTLRRFRGRGVAGAMLRHAFDLARSEGYARVALGVDSDSPTGAPSVYRRAGLDVQFATTAWHRPLR